ncbi:MAG TPA: hypothetical protein VLA98_03515 [Solirubrobacteraceae bacterium]|nr:hypothetical protein [Solirubrobacteraceae bacterium]
MTRPLALDVVDATFAAPPVVVNLLSGEWRGCGRSERMAETR